MNGLDFWHAFSLIMVKVFPLLIMPCLAAWLVRYLMPRLHRWLLGFPDLAFYLWAFALALAIAVTTKSIVGSRMSLALLLMIAVISLLCCILQFALGRYVGRCYRPRRMPSCHPERQRRIPSGNVREVTAGQALGQKNTVFAIWMGYTFMTAETAIVGGLYSIWHNLYNSHQLRRANRIADSV
jgi:BASS family bile acid:Na+ symporter